MAGLLDYLSDKYQPENVQKINERMVELSSLLEISQILNASLDLNQVLNNIMLIPMGRLMITKGIVWLRKKDTFYPQLWKGVPENIAEKSFEIYQFPEKLVQGITDDAFSDFNQIITENKLSISIPIHSHNRIIGLLQFGAKLNRKPFNDDEISFLESLTNLSATSVENARQVDEIKSINLDLDAKIQQLKTLFDIAQGLSATLDPQKIEKLLTYAIMGQMLVNVYAIVYCAENNVVKKDCKGFTEEFVDTLISQFPVCSDIENAVKTEDITNVKLKKKLASKKACVFIPMRHQNKMMGFIILGPKINKATYSDVDLEFLSTLVSQAVVSLENARLFQETLEKERLEQELKVATSIQQKLLPRSITTIDGYDIWGENISSKEVGGDYFDVIQISANRYCLAIGDVSGKSVPAALLMANLQAGLRTIILEDLPLSQITGRLNDLIYQNTDMDKYITFFVGILDNTTHKFSYVNAGHNPPYLLRANGQMELLSKGGIILGMMPNFPYEFGEVTLEFNDMIFCYTDGINEAMNPAEEEYGEEKLETLLQNNRELSSNKLSDLIYKELEEFADGAEQADDITLLTFKRI